MSAHSFDEQRQRAARAAREAAAAHEDPTQAALLEMCADDLSRPVPVIELCSCMVITGGNLAHDSLCPIHGGAA